MDSDSSHDGDDCHSGTKRRDWENRQNSDVSDDENFSRGAKSIDSPPESPPRGGGNLDSPPASPAQGVESPHSVYSGSRRSSGSSDGTGEYPQSPDSPPPKTPESVENENSRSRERRVHVPISHDRGRISSASPNRSRSVSPDRSHFKHHRESESPSPRGRLSRPLSYASPESNDSQNRLRRNREQESPEHRTVIRNSERRVEINRRSPSPNIYLSRNKGPGSSDRERSGDRSRSSTPKQDRSPVIERRSRHKSPDNYFSRRHREWEQSPGRKVDAPKRTRRGSSSSNSSASPIREVNRNNRSPSNPTSPERNRSDIRNIDCDDRSRSSRRSSQDRKRLNTESLGLDDISEGRKAFRSHRTSAPVNNERLKTSYGPQSPGRQSDSDGRSNISSNSSIGSPASQKSRTPEPKRGNKPDKIEIKSHGEDLSDVSDVESIGSASDVEQKPKETKKSDKEKEEKERKNGLHIEEAEQLDFEAEESESPAKKSKEKELDSEEGEVKELEEGELSDEGELRPEETEPRPVCRFFSRGQCTWGSSCRFVHPGVTDKGNYTMFDMVRPLVPINAGPPPPHMYPPIDCYRPPIERPPMMGPPPYQQPMMRREEPPSESAWERGLRQAKEMLRRSSKRKETDADFEEKKMTLTLSGQEEYDKDNTDYYPRPASPVYDDYHDRSKEGEKRYRSVSDRFSDYPPPSSYYRGDGWYDDRSHYHRSSRHHSSSAGYGGRSGPEDYYDSRKKKYSSREVVVQRGKEGGSPPSTRSRGGRGDEWADPWMRSKSPSRKSASRKKSYSSRSRSSSYSSSSSSRSSSYSSYSRSRSSASHSGTSRSRSRSSFNRKKLSPLSRRAKSPFSRDRRVGEGDRGLHMNPPPPSPRGGLSPRRNPTPPPQADRANRNISARLIAAAMRERSVSSTHSSSGTESSGSSSDSSSESGSSSSSSSPVRHKSSVQHTRKKIELEEKLAQAVKAKAMDALKLSGQKQQIKLTLKGTGSSISERLSAPVTRKRPAPDSPHSGDGDSSPTVSKKKNIPSRREELLKQLKAVEDAIARKRSKI